MTKKTIIEVTVFLNMAQRYLKRHEKDDGKFSYALKKVTKRCIKTYEAHIEAVEDLKVEHCSVDDRGNILKDAQGGYQFSKDSQRAWTKAVKALDKGEVDVDSFVVKAPDDLTDDEREAFAGFVIADVMEAGEPHGE